MGDRDATEIAEFLRHHPPFDSLDEEALAAVASAAEVEAYPARATILDSAEETSESAYVVRRGSVELIAAGRLLDLLGEGEMFAFASLLEQGPMGFVARAAEQTLAYRIPDRAIRPVLERAAAVSFVAGSLSKSVRLLSGDQPEHPPAGGRAVGELVRGPALVCEPSEPVQRAAKRMVDAGVSCVVVELGDRLGIVTDRDIRARVAAAGAGPETPLSEVMTAPAWTVAADRTETEALFEMLEHGVRHLPVLAANGRLVGVLDDVDLLASERRAPFRLRARIARSADAAGVAAVAAELGETVIALHDAGLSAAVISRTIASIHNTIARRLIEITEREREPPPVRYAWLAMGSFGRREPFPSSDVDCALAWEGDDDPDLRQTMIAFADRVLDGLSAAGLPLDRQRAVASSPLFARSIDEWERAAAAWLSDPDRDRGLMLLSVVVESDAVWGSTAIAQRLAAAFAQAPNREHALRRLAAAAVAERPPTGFFRDFVLEDSGERKGVLDIKRGGLLPIESLARWAGLAAGVGASSTTARLRAAEDAGTLEAADAVVLRDAYELVCALRMEHQVEQLRAGEQPDNLIEPKRLAPITRTSLKEAFRAVAKVQRGISADLGFRLR